MPSRRPPTDPLDLARGTVISITGSGGKTTLMKQLASQARSVGRTCLVTTTTRIMKPSPAPGEELWLVESIEQFKIALQSSRAATAIVASGLEEEGAKLAGLPPSLVDEIAALRAFDYIFVEADGSRHMPLKGYAEYEPVVPASTAATLILVGLGALGRRFSERSVHRMALLSERLAVVPGTPISAAVIASALTHPDGYIERARGRRLVILNQMDTPIRARAAARIAEALRQTRADGVFARGAMTGYCVVSLW